MNYGETPVSAGIGAVNQDNLVRTWLTEFRAAAWSRTMRPAAVGEDSGM